MAKKDSIQRMDLDESKINAVNVEESSVELQRSWFSFSREIFCLNAYPNGITFSVHKNDPQEVISPRIALRTPSRPGRDDSSRESVDVALGDTTAEFEVKRPKFLPNQFDLRLRDTRDYQLPIGRYFLYKENYAHALEYHLSQLHKSGSLSSSVFYFGVATDPFLYSERKGHVTSACVELLEQFHPGFLVLQTRSSKVLGALPLLRALKDRVVVSLSIESMSDRLLEHYTPHQPKLSERLFVADRLREEGIKVQLRASPVLPYGDFYRDAWRFAELLVKHADYVSFGGFASGNANEEQQLRDLPIARKLAAEQQFRMLRPFAYRCVYYAVQSLAPEKLHLPTPALLEPSQLSLFGALPASA